MIVARLSRSDAADLLVDEQRSNVAELREELSAKRARLDALALDFADGLLTRSQPQTATQRLRSRIGEIEAEMADTARADILGDLVRAEDVREAWEALGRSRQRAVIDTLAVVRVRLKLSSENPPSLIPVIV
ncbi:hypothetical protein [Saccharothrix luteola]|uniref:hypothetical protein n=1 Tax=Saccharothrix luteola TaxID=2893018 RepID=UPI001E3BC7EF|nr:hypothetical protein [Saccharothrix luteola]MCC8247655.1 hypothetical protein [Saccharothrix luteola]